MQLRKEKGISSIIGSIFLILIAFLVLSIFVLIFNNYNQYAKTFLTVNNQDVNRMETSIQFKRMIFGSTSQQIASQTFQSQKNTANLPFYPIQNMNFSQNMNGWFFTRTYNLVPQDFATACISPAGVSSLPATFTLSITNNKNSQNDIAQVSLTVNSQITISTTLPSVPTGWTPSISGNTITWTAILGSNGKYEPYDIDNGKTVYFSWTAKSASPGTYSNTVTIMWVNNDQPPFTDGGTAPVSITIGQSSSQNSCSSVSASFVPNAGGAVGSFDPTTPIASESGPGSIYVFFEPTISGQPINQNQQLGATMNFTASFTLDSTTSQSISSAGFSFGYSLDTFNCQGGGGACNLNTTVYLIQEATGKSFKLYTVLFPKNFAPTGFVFISGIKLPSINWVAGKYDLVISTVASMTGNQPGSENYPVEMQMHFDDVGIALSLVSSSYFVDTWSSGQYFIISTGQSVLSVSSINMDIILGTSSGPVYAYAYLNDFSRGTQQIPFWTLQNSTVFTSSTDLQVNIPPSQVRLYVNNQGQILLRIYAVSLSQFTLSVSVTAVVGTSDHAHASLQLINSSPFAVHLVSLYVNSPNGLVHLDINSSALGVSGSFDYWLAPGQLLTITIPVQWQSGQVYTVVVTTSTGVVVASSFTS